MQKKHTFNRLIKKIVYSNFYQQPYCVLIDVHLIAQPLALAGHGLIILY